LGFDRIFRAPKGDVLSAFVSNKKLRWGKVVQFSIGEDLSNYRNRIIEVLRWIADRSCLTFQESATGDRIKFTTFGDNDNPGQGCWSYFGRQGGEQAVNLEVPGCVDKNTIFHEVFHALGKVHEQSRPDRDNYIEIVYDNIEPAMRHNFDIQQRVDPVGTTYELQSIMHYEPTAFSRNGKPTIISKSGETSFGNTQEPTQTDLYELNKAYQCNVETQTEAPEVPEVPETEGSGEGSGVDYSGVDSSFGDPNVFPTPTQFDYAEYVNAYNDDDYYG